MSKVFAVITSLNCYWQKSCDECDTDCACVECQTRYFEQPISTFRPKRNCSKQEYSPTDYDKAVLNLRDGYGKRTNHAQECGFEISNVMLISVKQGEKTSRYSHCASLNLRKRHVSGEGSKAVDLGYALGSSMLQQILKDMYIEPELLAELGEEQKQILFCKMREEQVRRWEENEKKRQKEEAKKSQKPQKPGKKCVKFLKAKDGEPWVWVMGEHKDDKSIELIVEEEAQENARIEAMREAEELRKKTEEELLLSQKEEEERLERERREKEEEIKKKAEEAAIYESIKEAQRAAKLLEQVKREGAERLRKKSHEIQRHENGIFHCKQDKDDTTEPDISGDQESIKRKRRASLHEVAQLVTRRSSELYTSYKAARETLCKQAEENSKVLDKEWKEQETKAKQADQERRAAAKRALALHRKSVTGDKKPPVPKKPTKYKQSRGPPNRQAIVKWFNEMESTKGAGLDPKTKEVARWFHGIISREKAEELLDDCCAGTFLVRVSERVWGYAVSYKAKGKCKHFLVDATDTHYSFFGTNQLQHKTLADVIEYHKAIPVSLDGQEKLLFPCGQSTDPPDYQELFQKTVDQSYM